MTLGTPPARFAPLGYRLAARGRRRIHGLPGVTGSGAYDGPVGKTATAAWGRPRAYGDHVGSVPVRCRFGTFANWYTLVVSNARQASKILQELQSVQVSVGASLRARH